MRFHAVVAALAIVLCSANLASGVPVDILPLGNSITQSLSTQYSYRYSLWKKLIDANIEFDFIGSLQDNKNGNPLWPDYMGQSFDQDHEGHAGWRADEITNGEDGSPTPNLSTWLQTYTPDIVLLHAGTNDARYGHPTATTVADLEGIIDVLQADNPNVIVLLAELIPVSGPENPNIIDLNTHMDAIAAGKTTATSSVIVVDQFTGFDAVADTVDGIHPNPSGEEKMAQKWADAIADAVPEPPPVSLAGLGMLALLRRRRR